VSAALGINLHHDKTDLHSTIIRIEDHGIKFPAKIIMSAPRIGVDYAGDDAKLPYRFYIKKINP
jgi:DNA-3-methyladenine glycosylase